MSRPCLIGLDEPETAEIINACDGRHIVHPVLPKMMVRDGNLWVDSPVGTGMRRVSRVVYHGIFENDHDFLAGLALWGGRCLPNAHAMMDCRLKLPCLVRALQHSRFAAPARGFAMPGVVYETERERVAKWGNWHCGENKARFSNHFEIVEPTIVEPFLSGRAVRMAIIGDRAFQIELRGDGWLKSIHHDDARLIDIDSELLTDTRTIAAAIGLEIAATDYIIDDTGTPHLLEINHIPNVTRFPEIREAYLDYVVDWLRSAG